jgi:hypothetical protein
VRRRRLYVDAGLVTVIFEVKGDHVLFKSLMPNH